VSDNVLIFHRRADNLKFRSARAPRSLRALRAHSVRARVITLRENWNVLTGVALYCGSQSSVIPVRRSLSVGPSSLRFRSLLSCALGRSPRTPAPRLTPVGLRASCWGGAFCLISSFVRAPAWSIPPSARAPHSAWLRTPLPLCTPATALIRRPATAPHLADACVLVAFCVVTARKSGCATLRARPSLDA